MCLCVQTAERRWASSVQTAAENLCCLRSCAALKNQTKAASLCGENRSVQMGGDFPADMGVFINSPGFIGIYSGFQNLKFLADICGKIGEKEIREAMSKVGLDPDNKTKVDNYSLGMKQKLGLAQAIMERQDILVLDEPFNALDYKTYEDVKIIIRMLKAEGKTIFMTSHRYKDIEQLCDQVYSLENCRLVPITDQIAARYREME